MVKFHVCSCMYSTNIFTCTMSNHNRVFHLPAAACTCSGQLDNYYNYYNIYINVPFSSHRKRFFLPQAWRPFFLNSQKHVVIIGWMMTYSGTCYKAKGQIWDDIMYRKSTYILTDQSLNQISPIKKQTPLYACKLIWYPSG